MLRRSFLLGASASALLALSRRADAFFLHGGGSSGGGGGGCLTPISPNGVLVSAPSGTITDNQCNVWAFGSVNNPTGAPAGIGYFITKGGVTQNNFTTTATGSWINGATSIPVPGGLTITPGMAVFDASWVSPISGPIGQQLGFATSYAGTTLTLAAPGANFASQGSTDSLTIGQSTWANGLLPYQGAVYSVDATDRWMIWSDQIGPIPQWCPIAYDPRNFPTAVSASGTLITTAVSPSAVPSDPAWPIL